MLTCKLGLFYWLLPMWVKLLSHNKEKKWRVAGCVPPAPRSYCNFNVIDMKFCQAMCQTKINQNFKSLIFLFFLYTPLQATAKKCNFLAVGLQI
jgi:hypothetical protein